MPVVVVVVVVCNVMLLVLMVMVVMEGMVIAAVGVAVMVVLMVGVIHRNGDVRDNGDGGRIPKWTEGLLSISPDPKKFEMQFKVKSESHDSSIHFPSSRKDREMYVEESPEERKGRYFNM